MATRELMKQHETVDKTYVSGPAEVSLEETGLRTEGELILKRRAKVYTNDSLFAD
jgi:hypothetical protein